MHFSPYLNNTLHEIGLVVNQLAAGLGLDQVLDGAKVAETQRFDVVDETGGLVVLQIGAITGLIRQRLARGVNSLRILLEDSDNLGALHLVTLLIGNGLSGRRNLGKTLAAVLLGLRLGITIGVLVALQLGR